LGGGKLVKSMLEDQLIDRFEIFVMPALLRDGVPIFPPGFKSQQLYLVSSTAHPQGGVVELIYNVPR
jgi:dihydrofolate reductase